MNELAVMCGVLTVVAGVALWSVPAAVIVGGLLLFAAGVGGMRGGK